MADRPAFRTDYMSLLLPAETGEGEVRRLIRESVIRALAATDEWPIRVDVVTGKRSDDGHSKRGLFSTRPGLMGRSLPSPVRLSSPQGPLMARQVTWRGWAGGFAATRRRATR